MQRETREVWAKRVERLRDSGLSVKQFASETGVNAHTLSWWRYQLGAQAKKQEARPSSPKRRQARSPKASSMTFVELATTTSTPLAVVLAGGREIRVPVGFDAATLERLLAVLERPA